MKFNHIKHGDNGLFYYDSGLNQFTQEEVDELNKEYYDKENECIEEILNDGFIEFPILWDNGPEPIWSSCYLPPDFTPSCTEGFKEKYGLKYNIYIPSYKRAGITMTDKMLESWGIENYYLCIDPSQYSEYKEHIDISHIIIRDPSFKSEKKLNLANSVVSPDYLHGASGVFNSLLYISKSLGEECYTTIDDDIFALGLKAYKGSTSAGGKEFKYDKDDFYRSSQLRARYGFDFKEFWADMEELFTKARNKSFMSIDKYGLTFASPIMFRLGSRSYSFYLTDNRIQLDHMGQQNNDIITSLEMAKYGYVNMLFTGYQYCSADSQVLAGGATGVYKKFGTLDKSKVLIQAQPNYSKISYIYSRPHHIVNFNNNPKRLVGAVKRDD